MTMIYADRLAVALAVLLGLAVGSFLNTCAWRLPQQKTIINDRSACPRCQHLLGALDLIPLLSFLCLKGRCKYCREKIALRYPLMELLTGTLFAAIFIYHGFHPISLVYLVMAGFLLVAALIDLEHFYIPNRLIAWGLVSGTLLRLLLGTGSMTFMVLGFITGCLPMLAVYLVSRGGMGAGDVKLSALMGVFLGWKLALAALFLAFLLGAVTGVLLLASGLKGRKDPIPFGPFLAFGGIGASLWGLKIIGWYGGLMWP